MKYINKDIYKELKIDCEKCFGFSCIALYFSKTDGFPEDKESGKPCINLQSDFKCKVHRDLRKKGLKGCTAYDFLVQDKKLLRLHMKDMIGEKVLSIQIRCMMYL